MSDVLDVLKDIDLEELEKEIPEPRWKKPLLISIGVFLAVLIATWTLSNFLPNVVDSSSVRVNKLVFKDVVVVFEGEVLELLQAEFIQNEHREIKACLFGSIDGDDYIISSVEFPEVIQASVINVRALSCPVDTLIDLHSHPIDSCLASEHDVVMFDQRKRSNPSLRLMIMCGSDRFAIV